jgi:phage tail sheath protein FI
MPTYLSPGVYVEELEAGSRPIEGVGTAVAAFVGLAERGPLNVPTLVTNWSQFTQVFGDFVEGSYLAHAVYGYFQNGGGACFVVRVGGDGSAAVGSARRLAGALPASGSSALEAFRIEALTGDGEGEITVEVVDAEGEAPKEAFNLIVKRDGKVEETFERLTTHPGRQNAETLAGEPVAVGRGVVALSPAPPDVMPEHLPSDELIGDPEHRTGLGGLEAIDEVTMVCIPDLMGAYQRGAIDLEGVKAVQLGMIAHCELMGDRIAILDPPPGLSAQQVREWRVEQAGYDSKYATVYWPWIRVFDAASGDNVLVPPSGHVAGIWGRNDDTRGVHKAPANEVVRGAVGLELNITRPEHDQLNPVGINCIRAFPGRGIRVWGARTLSSDPAWRYVNVRRLFNYLEESILAGTDWVVFEPNDQALWSKIRRTIAAFLVNEWRKGALFGSTPDEAFYVKCDDETNPAEGIDAGQVVCEIGVAPVKPAEFVVFRLAQFSGGTSLVTE